MLSIVRVITPADSYALLSLADAKLSLLLTDSSYDAQLTALIDRVSSMISILTNRVFGKEEVVETFEGQPSKRLMLSRWPVKIADITSVVDGGVMDPADYR